MIHRTTKTTMTKTMMTMSSSTMRRGREAPRPRQRVARGTRRTRDLADELYYCCFVSLTHALVAARRAPGRRRDRRRCTTRRRLDGGARRWHLSSTKVPLQYSTLPRRRNTSPGPSQRVSIAFVAGPAAQPASEVSTSAREHRLRPSAAYSFYLGTECSSSPSSPSLARASARLTRTVRSR